MQFEARAKVATKMYVYYIAGANERKLTEFREGESQFQQPFSPVRLE